MNLLQIQIFTEAAKCLNYTKVAENLFMSVPSVSKYISSLEDELGYSLMLRDGKHLQLSEFGQAFLPYAEELLGKEDAIRDFLVRYRSNTKNTLTVYLSESLITTQFVEFYAAIVNTVNEFRKQHPETLLRLRFASTREAQMLQSERKADITIYTAYGCDYPAREVHNYSVQRLISFRYYLVVPGYINAGTVEEAIQQANILYYLDKPAARHVFHSLYDRVNGSCQVLALPHQGEIMMRIISGEGGGILSENAMEIIKNCDVRIFLLDPYNLGSSLYAQCSTEDNRKELADFLHLLGINFRAGSESELNG